MDNLKLEKKNLEHEIDMMTVNSSNNKKEGNKKIVNTNTNNKVFENKSSESYKIEN